MVGKIEVEFTCSSGNRRNDATEVTAGALGADALVSAIDHVIGKAEKMSQAIPAGSKSGRRSI